MTAEVWDLESGNVTLQKTFETSFKTHADTKIGLANDPGETRGNLKKKTGDGDALIATAGEPERELATLRGALKKNEKYIESLELQAASVSKAIADFATLTKDHRLNYTLRDL